MSASNDAANKLSGTAVSVPESPTTARPFEMDDDDVQESSMLESSTPAPATGTVPAGSGAAAGRTAADDAAPQQPPRPMTEAQKHQQMLKEAFPTLDDAVIRAVLTASGGKIDPAFNALLEMTDPEAASREVEEPPPPQPPRPTADRTNLSAQSQLEADELYARQLAQHYENVGAYEERTSSRRPARQQTGLDPNRNFRGHGDGSSEQERNFLDDDLPVIKENLRKGFQETQKTVNTWFQTLKKRIDEEFSDEPHQQGQQGSGRSQFPQQGQSQYRSARSSGDNSRRSGDYERYDADPQVLSDDFAGMKFTNDGTPVGRAQPNPNVFRPPPPSVSPKPADGRKVAFRDGTEEIGDVYNVSPQSTGTGPAAGASAAGGKPSKWQPLSTVEPSPVTDNDPFSLGDSDDERDSAKAAAGHKKTASSASSSGAGEIKMEDAERLRKAAAEAMNESLVDDANKTGDAAPKKA